MSFNGIVQVEVLDDGGRKPVSSFPSFSFFLVFPRFSSFPSSGLGTHTLEAPLPVPIRAQHVLFGKSVAPAKC